MDKKIRPYKNRKQTVKRERAIMLVSSAFVMAALTITGIYMKGKNVEDQNDGYSIDLAEYETNVGEQYAKLVDEVNTQTDTVKEDLPDVLALTDIPTIEKAPEVDGELDYMPRKDSIVDFEVTEVDSGLVEIPGLTDIPEAPVTEAPQIVEKVFSFTEEEGLYVPVMNDILMHFSMDRTIYFATLDQYKYNPAVIFKAVEGCEVYACADAKVVDMYQNEELGQVMVLDLGDGYRAIYGQLKDCNVAVGDAVSVGQVIGHVGTPTKYYSVEGVNLYFSLEKDGQPINPEGMM
ncbi:MAG: M23 family metallopeptidase [Lachnospiraceae bacterium]|nr:M23 family metallopeptidase [Lachnospiraceae bacterium]